jgi:hypothetical protein
MPAAPSANVRLAEDAKMKGNEAFKKKDWCDAAAKFSARSCSRAFKPILTAVCLANTGRHRLTTTLLPLATTARTIFITGTGHSPT